MATNAIKAAVQDSHIRPIIKTVSWRILAMIITGAVVYVYTGEIKKSGEISVVAGLILTFAYYLHERFWAWVRK
ncbi:MAG: hypothetical protein A2934_03235 [Candidatus Sungbacteria bacterium RIFCSPLOWO2_01_FULL_47_10]|uniref:DUF2061 domain-containing protein n=1 Tax=Candidatus Sungbacteria bacterium RIFCSPLOWO2_01_FULL_47_10 TaxID=1802276 RepID=A0A1G2L6H7_9BACT|nr:MAG: hypothetical protein A2934_03235 [Candidatus Sungbacteria bacterium RIFCSPLOWO2_01_FULL_47_10]